MKKLRFNSGAKAIARNAEAAEARGYDMMHLQFCWGYFKDDKGFYLEVPDEERHLLKEEEIARLEE